MKTFLALVTDLRWIYIYQALLTYKMAVPTLLLLALKFRWINLKQKSYEINHTSFHHLIVLKVKHVHKHLLNESYMSKTVFVCHFISLTTVYVVKVSGRIYFPPHVTYFVFMVVLSCWLSFFFLFLLWWIKY